MVSAYLQWTVDGHLTWSNTVTVERFLFWHFHALLNSLVSSLFSFQGSTESTCTLLVHFGSWRNTVNGHEEQLLGFDLSKQMLNVVEDANEHFFFA
jgi:hypothetical protein